MARLAHWAIAEPTGRRHDVSVDRSLFGQMRVVLDRRIVPRFDRVAEGDRHVFSLGDHLATVLVPRSSADQPALSIDGKAVLSSETILTPGPPDTAAGAAAGISGQDWSRFQLLQRRNSGGAWFYWIGGASILNSVLNAAGTQFGLALGLGVTYLIDEIAKDVSNTVRTPIYAFLIDIAIAGGFLLIGRAARRGNLVWYAVGIVLYLLDGLLFVLAQDLLGTAVHAIGIYGLISGWRAARALETSATG